MSLHIPKGCVHNFSKLTKGDIKHLLHLMQSWSEWEKISPGVGKQLKGLYQHLERLGQLTEDLPDSVPQNFASAAMDW